MFIFCLCSNTEHFLTIIKNRKSKLAVKTIMNILEQQLKYMSKDGNSLSLFPSICYYNSNTPIEYNIQMGWCYGDQSACIGVYNASRVVNSKFYNKISQEIAIHCSKRDTIESSFLSDLTDACFCHGTSSAAYIFKKMYKIYKTPIFFDLYIKFIGFTLERRRNFEISKSGYAKFSNSSQNYINANGLLDGISGVGLVLIDYLSYLSNDQYLSTENWDSVFLLQDF